MSDQFIGTDMSLAEAANRGAEALAREARQERANLHGEAIDLLVKIMRDPTAEARDRIDCAIALVDLMDPGAGAY